MSFVVVVEEILKRFKNMEINQGGVGCKSQVASRKSQVWNQRGR